jgi:PAS domain S-box-containing protein
MKLFDVLARQVADLIEPRRAEITAREIEDQLRRLANTAPVIIWMNNADKQCTYVNQTWLDLTGQSFESALGTGWMDVVHADDVAHSLDAYMSAFERREPFQIEYRLRRDDGEFRSVVTRGVPRYNVDGSFVGYVGWGIDVSESRLAEETLATISQRLIDAQEEERGRIARELQDDITQQLAMLSVSLDLLAQSGSASSAGKREIEKIRKEVEGLSEDVRAFSHRLHPARLDYLGIAEAAGALCQEMSAQHGVEIRFHGHGAPNDLSRRIVVCLYRVLQEALQNAIKHSGARKVEVFLCRKGDQMELTVCDRGAGFDLKTTQGRGLGLVSMKERLKTVHGHLAIRSEPKLGTLIQAWVPLLQEESERSDL